MRLKIEGVLILCIVVVLAKTCFEKFAPKVRRLVHDLLPVKTLVHQISQNIRRIEYKYFWLEGHLMYIQNSAKISISIFWFVPTWTVTLNFCQEVYVCDYPPIFVIWLIIYFDLPISLVTVSIFSCAISIPCLSLLKSKNARYPCISGKKCQIRS